jgi:hypothetical protein
MCGADKISYTAGTVCAIGFEFVAKCTKALNPVKSPAERDGEQAICPPTAPKPPKCLKKYNRT